MTPHFPKYEVSCKCGCGLLPPQDFMDKVERVRIRFGRPMKVTSGARCCPYNHKVSSTGLNGPHTKRAIDFGVIGSDALELVRIALEEGFTGIGVNQKGKARFIHLDDLPNEVGQPRPWIWSY